MSLEDTYSLPRQLFLCYDYPTVLEDTSAQRTTQLRSHYYRNGIVWLAGPISWPLGMHHVVESIPDMWSQSKCEPYVQRRHFELQPPPLHHVTSENVAVGR